METVFRPADGVASMRIREIQEELVNREIDGWLFFDHHQRDSIAYRVLQFSPARHVTRRWYYFVPATGEPRGLVHRIEPHILDSLPGTKIRYASWQEQRQGLGELLSGCRSVAMQYSPFCSIPYVATVDAGTVELVRSLGLEVVSSADLVQRFEAILRPAQVESHLEAGRRVDQVRQRAFDMIAARLREGAEISEFAVRQYILDEFRLAGLITDHGPIVAVNANCSNPHYEPTVELCQPIRPGDLVLIDMWAKLNSPGSIYYDITWTGFCGSAPPPAILEVFRHVRTARNIAIQKVKEAAVNQVVLRGFEVDDAAREHIKAQGFGDYFIHRTGHSIGQEVHGNGANMDNLETHDERTVCQWSCFSIEPGIYLPAFGIRSEVNMLVRERDAIVTGEIQEELVGIQ